MRKRDWFAKFRYAYSTPLTVSDGSFTGLEAGAYAEIGIELTEAGSATGRTVRVLLSKDEATKVIAQLTAALERI